jgi:uncharacterized damage-inducible protein DinB
VTATSQDLRYPIGQYVYPGTLTAAEREERIARIAAGPAALRSAVAGLSPAQLDTPYRPGGWTARQVVHHVPDSHLNAYIRFKLAVTEPRPTIRPYEEALWAELPDGRAGPVEPSLDLLDALTRRWVPFLRSLTAEQWTRSYHHPAHGRDFPLDEILSLYAWHGEHHAAHITSLRRRMGWGPGAP